jgi:TPR repeat protein
MYRDGEGITQDYSEAVKWYSKAAEQGFAEAQYGLGWMHREGRGVPQDYIEAAKWYLKAAEQGLDEAQFNLGRMYYNREGVPQDLAEALKWFRKAAEQGNADAQNYAATVSWFEENKWYSPQNPEMESYADAMGDHYKRTHNGEGGINLLNYVRQEVEKRFPEKFAHQIHISEFWK